ncbi:hypothetical protein [Nocardioides nitrophenolicus]|uniref:hypothetical protein n=1 Tax=Nocardioides nitrophenolicus TaxID=60489 RepID=UPI00195BEE6F|nr:hypothetical protein [Nocardioides nitrophenolicus]MBM7516980.1 hypothetical protein [Nocardioides nitrophenolicus]
MKYRFRASSRFWRPKAAAATVAGLCFCLTVLASCGSSDPKTLTRPTGATPAVTEATAELPVPGGCPTSADVANAALGEPEEGDGYAAVDVELLNNFLETALPTAGACAYAELERRTASSSDATYRRIEVFYFNLGEPARPTADSLKYWANQAGAVDTSDEGDGRAYELPESFSGWTGGAISLDDDSTTWFLGDEDLIPEYTDRDNIRVTFNLNADDADAIEANSTAERDKPSVNPAEALANGTTLLFAATFPVTDHNDYTADVTIAGSLLPFTADVTNSRPGEYAATSTGSTRGSTATNTSKGRTAVLDDIAIVAVYPLGSAACNGYNDIPKAGGDGDDGSFCGIVVGGTSETTLSPDAVNTSIERPNTEIELTGRPEPTDNVADFNSPPRLVRPSRHVGGRIIGPGEVDSWMSDLGRLSRRLVRRPRRVAGPSVRLTVPRRAAGAPEASGVAGAKQRGSLTEFEAQHTEDLMSRFLPTGSRRERRSVRFLTILAAAACLLALPLGYTPSGASAAEATTGSRSEQQVVRNGQRLTLALASAAEVTAGDTVSFTGAATRRLHGRKVRLQRSVAGGAWVDVAVGRVGGDGRYAIAAVASSGGVTEWRALAKTKAKRKHGKIKKPAKVVRSNKVTNTVYQWYSLKEMTLTASVRGNSPGGCTGGCTGFSWGSASIGAREYAQAYRMQLSSSGPSVAEWNLE